MRIEGSCSCGAVHFIVESKHPVPYQRCYCSICRKTAGGGGYSINTSASFKSLQVTGKEHVKIFRATVRRKGDLRLSEHQRHFCSECGSHLWAYDPRYPDLVHPVAGAIDTPLAPPSENVHVMTGSMAQWVLCEGRQGDAKFREYPDDSIADFHELRGWTVE